MLSTTMDKAWWLMVFQNCVGRKFGVDNKNVNLSNPNSNLLELVQRSCFFNLFFYLTQGALAIPFPWNLAWMFFNHPQAAFFLRLRLWGVYLLPHKSCTAASELSSASFQCLKCASIHRPCSTATLMSHFLGIPALLTSSRYPLFAAPSVSGSLDYS